MPRSFASCSMASSKGANSSLWRWRRVLAYWWPKLKALKRLRWPPRGLGLGTPLNSALVSPETRRTLTRVLWQSAALGVATATVVIALDQVLFKGASLERLRSLGTYSFTFRLGAVAYSAIGEELLYRLGAATLVAAIVKLVLSRRSPRAREIAEWTGVLVAAFLFGLAHVGNMPNAAHPVLRAVTLNGFTGIVLGLWYWRRGLEAAIFAHFAGDALIYVGLVSLLAHS
jgi:membrane protease YdiL (CAAX protease family)